MRKAFFILSCLILVTLIFMNQFFMSREPEKINETNVYPYLTSIVDQIKTCEKPCWKSIYVGQTSKEELTEYISANFSNPFSRPRIESLTPTYESVSWVDTQYDVQTVTYIHDGVIERIEFFLGQNIETPNLFQVLGEPDAYAAYKESYHGAFVRLWLYFEEPGLVIELRPIDPDSIGCELPINDQMVLYSVQITYGSALNMRKRTNFGEIGVVSVEEWDSEQTMIPISYCK